MALAAGIPMPTRLHHRRHGPERLRDRPRPAARLGRRHHRPAREARPRGAPGRHRPRAVARPQLRHPVLAARRRPGRQRSRCSPTSSCASRSGAACGRRGEATAASGGGAPGDRVRGRHRCWRSSPRSSARLVQLAVSRQREYLADASSVELTRNPARAGARAGQDLGGQGGRSRSPTAPPSTCTSPTRSRSSRSARSALFSTHPPIVDRINRLRELTGEPPLDARRTPSTWRTCRVAPPMAAGAGLRRPRRGLPPVRGPWYPSPRRRAADGRLAIGPR